MRPAAQDNRIPFMNAVLKNEKCRLGNSQFGKTIISATTIKEGETVFTETGEITAVQTRLSYQVDWDKHYEPHGFSAFLNHSCRPNTALKAAPGGMPVFYALRDIAPGEELTIDYCTFEYKTKVLADIKCLCGHDNCRGEILGYSKLSPKDRASYGRHIADYLKTPPPAGKKSSRK